MILRSTNGRALPLIGVLVILMFTTTLTAQNMAKPAWYDQHDATAGIAAGYGNSPDLTVAVLTALGDLARQLEVKSEVITTETAQGYRNTAVQDFGAITVVDTAIIMSYAKGDAEWYQTELVFHLAPPKLFQATQKLTSVGVKNFSTCDIISNESSINDVLTVLENNGVDIKKQIVPDRSGYQFYLRLQMTIP